MWTTWKMTVLQSTTSASTVGTVVPGQQGGEKRGTIHGTAHKQGLLAKTEHNGENHKIKEPQGVNNKKTGKLRTKPNEPHSNRAKTESKTGIQTPLQYTAHLQ